MSIPSLKQDDRGVWYVHWTEQRRSKRVSTRTSDLAEAKAFLGQWLLMEREAPMPGAVFTVADLWSVYEAKHVMKNVEATATAGYSWKNLREHFGALHVAAINQDVVDAYVEKRAAGRIGHPSKPSTVRRELAALSACLNWCSDPRRKIIPPGSVPGFDLPAESAPRDRWLRTEELKRLFEAAEALRDGDTLSRGERFLWLALETAARKEAIQELTWDRVDLEVGVIDYRKPGRRVTKKKRACVPISKTLRPVLERAYHERVGELVIGPGGDVYQTVVAIARKAGVEGVSPHVLRHTAATHMARRGVPLYSIAGVLGNTLAMVEKVYAKHAPDALARAVEFISG